MATEEAATAAAAPGMTAEDALLSRFISHMQGGAAEAPPVVEQPPDAPAPPAPSPLPAASPAAPPAAPAVAPAPAAAPAPAVARGSKASDQDIDPDGDN